MKALYNSIVAILAVILITLIQPQKTSAQTSVSLQVFYDDLSPYGNWVDNPDYGYVWIPEVSQGFAPYNTNGHWVYTEVGWTWISDYAWGWAPFHYGRWYNDSYYGWAWVPDTEWGPGWVSWRHSSDYYGWAPIGPGISVEIAYSSGYNLPYNQWTFVRNRDFGRTNIKNYYVNNSNNTNIINNTTIINNIQRDPRRNTSYNGGPDRKEVQTRTGTAFAPVVIKDRDTPGQKVNTKELQLYRPKVDHSNAGGTRTAPSKVVDIKAIKPEAQRLPRTVTTNLQAVKESKNNSLPKAQQPIRANQAEKQPKQNRESKMGIPQTQQNDYQPIRQNHPTKMPQNNTAPIKQQNNLPTRQPQPTKQPQVQLQVQPKDNNQPVKQQNQQPQRNNQQPQRENSNKNNDRNNNRSK